MHVIYRAVVFNSGGRPLLKGSNRGAGTLIMTVVMVPFWAIIGVCRSIYCINNTINTPL